LWPPPPPPLRATTAALTLMPPLARLPLLPRAVPLGPALHPVLRPEAVASAVSRVAWQVSARVFLTLTSVAPLGAQPVVTLMPLLRQRLLPKHLVL
jgi:hypothetical protein